MNIKLLIACIIAATLLVLPAIIDSRQQAQPVPYFKKGQILLPDYACPDTLIVVDAEGLNKAMGLFEQGIIDGTDRDYDSVFHQHCLIVKF